MKTVLYADDNLKIVELVKALVERAGYQLLTARDGREAIEIARDENPDLILMDINIPAMNALTAVKELRDDGFNNPIIMLASSESEMDRNCSIEAGSDEYILKTIDMGEVETVLSRHLSDIGDFL